MIARKLHNNYSAFLSSRPAISRQKPNSISFRICRFVRVRVGPADAAGSRVVVRVDDSGGARGNTLVSHVPRPLTHTNINNKLFNPSGLAHSVDYAFLTDRV